MSSSILIKVFWTVLIAAGSAYEIYANDQTEKGLNPSVKAPRYPAYAEGYALPIIFLCVWLFDVALFGPRTAFLTSANLFVGVFFQISLYFLILLPLMPLLRRRISARACALLWLLPNYLFLFNIGYSGFPQPLVVFSISLNTVWIILWVWLAGFVGVMGYKLLSHLWFRRRLLRGAVPVTDEEVLEVWEEELRRANLRKPCFRLVVSPQAVTPMTVGLFRRTARVVLPQRQYTPEDLTLIFRHELIHLGRGDAWSKFFLVLCTAACWFNPLVWLAARKSADDMELSCDETVLLGSKEEVRLRYANLLLKTAGDQRGFTTCLSASARALRYRLGSVMTPVQKRSGALVVALTVVLLFLSSGYVALGYQVGKGEEVLFQGQDPHTFTLSYFSRRDVPDSNLCQCADPDGLRDYLRSLSLEQVMGNYDYDIDQTSYYLVFNSPEGSLTLDLQEDFIYVLPLLTEERRTQVYHVAGGLDLETLDAFFTVYPSLTYQLTEEKAEETPGFFSPMNASLNWVRGADGTVLYQPMEPGDTPSGLYAHDLPPKIGLDFSQPPQGPVTVTVHNWENTSQYTLTLEGPDHIFDRTLDAAHYSVEATMLGEEGEPILLNYHFDLEQM